MKKIFLFLLIAIAFTSCDVEQARANLEEFVIRTEREKIPMIMQNYTLADETVLSITIDSIRLFYANELGITPSHGYLCTTWKLKRELSSEIDYEKYTFLLDDYADFDNKKYLIELNDFEDVYSDGKNAKYRAYWPEKNPFRK